MPGQVVAALLDGVGVLGPGIVLAAAAVHLQGANGGDDDGGAGVQPGQAAFDVEELPGPQVGPEPGLGDHVIGQFQSRLGGDDGIAAVSDIGERAAVNEGGVVFQGLHQVRLQGFLQQHCHRPFGLQILGVNGLTGPRIADDDPSDPVFKVGEAGGQAEDGHDFGCHGDVEARFPGEAVGDAAQGRDDGAKRPVVHVDDPAPGDAAFVESQLVAPIDVVIDQRRQQVMGDADGVKVAGEVKVDVFHRHYLGVAAAGGAALHAEARPQGRFAEAEGHLLADPVERIAKADGRRRLAFAGRRRSDGGDQDQLAVRLVVQGIDEIKRYLGLGRAEMMQVLFPNPQLGADAGTRLHLGFASYFDIGLGHGISS